jgi:hypothetical protein
MTVSLMAHVSVGTLLEDAVMGGIQLATTLRLPVTIDWPLANGTFAYWTVKPGDDVRQAANEFRQVLRLMAGV